MFNFKVTVDGSVTVATICEVDAAGDELLSGVVFDPNGGNKPLVSAMTQVRSSDRVMFCHRIDMYGRKSSFCAHP